MSHRLPALALTLALLPGVAAANPAGPRIVSGGGRTEATGFVAGDAGAGYALPGGIRLELSPGTRLRVFPRAQALRLDASGRTSTWSVALQRGRLRIHLADAASKQAVLVQTPARLSVIALAGQVEAAVDGEQAAVANVDGLALSGVGSSWQALPARTERRRARLGSMSEQALPGAPALVLERSVWLSAGAPADLAGVRWEPVAGAVAYDVMLRSDGAVVRRTHVAAARTEHTFRAVEPGRYTLEVRAVDAGGIEGAPAQAQLRVVGVALPPGAYADAAGTIRLGTGQQARFTQADDLQMIWSGAHRFVAAPRPIALVDDKPTDVLLRVPGTPDAVVARLAPRPFSAAIQIGPAWAVWPHDPIAIRIRLRGDAASLPEPIQMIPRVTIGTEPVEVAWTRDGDGLSARVAPRQGPGPWVLRVDVSDQFGVPLGHDFVEIVGARR